MIIYLNRTFKTNLLINGARERFSKYSKSKNKFSTLYENKFCPACIIAKKNIEYIAVQTDQDASCVSMQTKYLHLILNADFPFAR
jgi:hypothetical protein